MNGVVIALLVIFAVGVVLFVYANRAPRKEPVPPVPPRRPIEPLRPSDDWTVEAGDEFAGLSESARCDLIFAVAELDDERSHQLLRHALDDPAPAVALAAAHALRARGHADEVQTYIERHPGERAQTLAQTLELLRADLR